MAPVLKGHGGVVGSGECVTVGILFWDRSWAEKWLWGVSLYTCPSRVFLQSKIKCF